MKKRLKPISVILTFILILQIGFANLSTVVHADTNQLISFAYMDFNNAVMNNMLYLQSDATVTSTGNKMRLTRDAGSLKGSGFYKQKVSVASDKSFSTFFTFEIHHTTSQADGIVFVLDTNTNSIGLTGAAIGYGGIDNSIGIEFDTYKNTGYDDITKKDMSDPSNDHIGIDVNGDPRSLAAKDLTNTLDLADGNVKYAWVDYNGATNALEVRISNTNSRPADPTLSYNINLSSTLGSSEVYAGFTAATGGSCEEHDIDSWYFDSKYNPIDTTANTYVTAPTTVAISASPSSGVTSTSTVSVNVKNADGSNAANIPVTMSTDNGQLANSTITTDNNGNATTTFTNNSTTSGTATIKAVAQGGAYNACTIGYVGVPKITNDTKTGTGDVTMNFASTDFTKNYIGDTLSSIRVESLPANGVLNYNGSPVTAGQNISISNANLLNFVPTLYWHGSTSFTWSALSNQNQRSNAATETLTFSAVNHAPNAPGSFTSTFLGRKYKTGTTLSPTWGQATDHDNDALTYILEFYNGSAWTQVYSGSASSCSYTLPSETSVNNAQFRVKAKDPGNLYSGYTYSDVFSIDNIKPVITLNGSSSLTLEVGTSYTENGATATDNYDGNLTSMISTSGTVNTSKLGTYTVTYTVSDAAGNVTTATRTVNVVDTTNPILTLNGDSDETVEVHHSHTDAGATATDNYDNDLTPCIVATGSVNVDKLGDYVISYNVTDSSGNKSNTVTRTIHVVDTTKPVITLNGDSSVTVEVHHSYTDAGAAATDNYDSSLTTVSSGTVNTDKLGDYTISYNVKDSSNNAADTVTRTVHVVDTTKPVITLNGSSDVTVEVHNIYTDEGAAATDNYDTDLTPNISTTGTVDTDKLGDYTVTYNVADSSENVADTVTRTVHVVDTTKPIITLNGDSSVTVEVHHSYTDAGAAATDNYDTSLTPTSSGSVNTDKLGDYTICYNVKDSSNNVADTVTRTIRVVDTTKPVITLNGSSSVTVEVHHSYTDAGAAATDNYDSSLTPVSSGSVNTDKLGDYTISYNVKDSSNNSAGTVIRTVHVVDTTKPVITLNGSSSVTVEVHHSYTDAGACAVDNYDGDLTSSIVASGSVNTDKVGYYILSYDVTDSSNNKADTVTRTVYVVDTTKPVITLNGSSSVTIEVHHIYTDAGAVAADNYDTGLTPASSGTVNTDKLGDYTISYNVKDTSNNAADTVTRTVHVVDTTKPVINLIGDSSITLEAGTSYTDKGATAVDNYDGDITAKIVTINNVNSNIKGDYSVKYNVTDAHGNAASEVVRNVHIIDKIQYVKVSGQITNQETKLSINSASVKLYDLDGNLIYQTISEPNGMYKFPAVKLGQYKLVAEDAQTNAASEEINVVPNSILDPTMTKNIALLSYHIEMAANPSTIVGDGVSTTQLSIVVKDKNGNAKPGLHVSFTAAKGSFPNGSTGITDSNGTCIVTYKSDKIEGLNNQIIPVTATVSEPSLGLSAIREILVSFEPGSIQGMVVDNETGLPVNGAIVVVSKDFNNDGIVDFYSRMTTGPDGKYKIAVPKGDMNYDVSITKPVQIGDTTELKTFSQTCPAGTISGAKEETFDANNTVAGLILTKQADGTVDTLSDYNGLSIGLFDASKINIVSGEDITGIQPDISSTIDNGDNKGIFQADGLSPNKVYTLAVYYTFDNGQKIIVGTASVTVKENGQINLTNVLIDPYGKITDSTTGKAIDGVRVVLYYANTPRNIAQGLKPDTVVNLPAIKGFKPSDNANPQMSDLAGEYGFMVFPNTDYYIKATKADYDTFTSQTISVSNSIVKYDIKMNQAKNTLPKTGSFLDLNTLIAIGILFFLVGGFCFFKKSDAK